MTILLMTQLSIGRMASGRDLGHSVEGPPWAWYLPVVPQIDQEWLSTVRREYSHCFGCGLDNAIGLQVDGFEQDGDMITARFTPRDEYRGFHDILHGGIVATALDETLAWTAILVAGSMAVTATMEMKYRKPAPADAQYVLRGRLVEQRGKRLVLEASCEARDVLIAEAKALFLATEPVPGPDDV